MALRRPTGAARTHAGAEMGARPTLQTATRAADKLNSPLYIQRETH